MTTIQPEAHEVRTFNKLLSQIGNGDFHHFLTEEMHEVVAALESHRIDNGGKKVSGKITITLDFTADGEVMKISGTHTVKLPKPKAVSTHLFVTPNNGLTRANPRQPDLPLTVVPDPRQAPAVVVS